VSEFEFEFKAVQGVQVCFLSGKFYGSQLDPLKKSVQDLANQGENLIIFDLSGIKEADSAGLGFIIRLMTTLQSSGGNLAICNVGSGLDGVLGLIRIPVATTLEEALTVVAREGEKK